MYRERDKALLWLQAHISKDVGHTDVSGQSNYRADLCVAKKNSHHSNCVYPISLQ